MHRHQRSSSLRELFIYVFSLVCIIFCINAVNYVKIKQAVKVLPPIPSIYEPVRFVFYSYPDNSISARFWFYDVSGKEIGSYERSWPGYALALEIQHLITPHTQVSFPVRVSNMDTFGRITSRGTLISKYFFKNNEAVLFSSAIKDLASSESVSISFLGRFIVDNSVLNTPFYLFKDRFVKTQLLSLEGCEMGVFYSVRCSQGNAVIIR